MFILYEFSKQAVVVVIELKLWYYWRKCLPRRYF